VNIFYFIFAPCYVYGDGKEYMDDRMSLETEKICLIMNQRECRALKGGEYIYSVENVLVRTLVLHSFSLQLRADELVCTLKFFSFSWGHEWSIPEENVPHKKPHFRPSLEQSGRTTRPSNQALLQIPTCLHCEEPEIMEHL
jgi:hypothetical protein